METPKLGKLEPVNLRDIWKNEPRDFTRWIADNLSLLGEVLNMELVSVQTEASAGQFFLDILAKETESDRTVAIENQLERTDHIHLGQLLTYAAGLDARVLVWVTPEFMDEHRAAIDWLNTWTPEEIEVYGVEVRVVRIGDSLPAPEFRPVAFPNTWSNRAKRTSEGLLPINRKYRDFFQPVIDELRKHGLPDRYAWARSYQLFPSEFPNISYVTSFSGRRKAWVYLWINLGDRDFSSQIFDRIHGYLPEIESELEGAEVTWLRHDNKLFSSVGLSRDGAIDDPEEKLAEIRAWMIDWLPRLKAAIDPRLETIMSEMQLDEK